MSKTSAMDLFEALAIADRKPPDLFRSLRDVDEAPDSVPQAHVVRRAWKAMGLDGVLYVDRRPTVYLKRVKRITATDERELHRRFWNHGVAPILVLATDTELRVYSSRAFPPKEEESPNHGDRLVATLQRTADALEIQQLVCAIESGQVFRQKPRSFDREKGIDRYLLKNLSTLRKLLLAEPHPLDPRSAHGLLTRALFTCYLIEREIIKGKHFSQPELAGINSNGSLRELLLNRDPLAARDVLYMLFEELKGTFNGSMFEADLAAERKRIRKRDMEALQRFFRADDLGSGQLTLGFWAYDFSAIPVETISAIYEDFIGGEGSDQQRETGAYYTPPHLVELVVDVATEGWDSLLDKTVLDAACGSGIFLVSVFNRMAEEWRKQNPRRQNSTRARELINLLRERFFGVDVQESACRVACFSLYLALLDQLEPRDIQDLAAQGQVLPRLLLGEGERQPSGALRTIITGNFFDDSLQLPRRKFDLVIGNPPWVSRGKSKDQVFFKWCESHPELPVPQKQIVHGFMWNSLDYLSGAGRCCFVLPSAVLLNRSTCEFQREWFGRVRTRRIVDLADMRFLLFAGAVRPAIIARFSVDAVGAEERLVAYLTPKVSPEVLAGEGVSVHAADARLIDVAEIVASASRRETPALWKCNLWATPRDRRFLQRLSEMPRLEALVGTSKKPKRWVKGQGLQPWGKSDAEAPEAEKRKPKQPWWNREDPFLNANRNFTLVLSDTDCEPVGDRFRELRRSPQTSVFAPPMVVANSGFTRIAYCGFRVLFRHALQSITGPTHDAGLLCFLAAVLNSKLARYFLFHTAASWGTERDRVLLFELLRMPFPLPDDIDDPAMGEIVADVSDCLRRLGREIDAQPLSREPLVSEACRYIDGAICEYYDLDEYERMLIEDTVEVFEPSSTPHSPSSHVRTLDAPTYDERKQYVDLLCSVLNTWGKRTRAAASGAVTLSEKAGLGIVTLRLGDQYGQYEEDPSPAKLNKTLSRLARLLPERRGGLTYLRGLKIFDRQWLHMVKPLTLRDWTRTAALNDADEIAAAILGGERGSRS